MARQDLESHGGTTSRLVCVGDPRPGKLKGKTRGPGFWTEIKREMAAPGAAQPALSAGEAEAGKQVQGQPGLHSKFQAS